MSDCDGDLYALDEVVDEDEQSPIMKNSKEEHLSKKDDNFFTAKVQPCVAEFVGTAVLVFVGTMSAAAPVAGPLAPALAHGLVLMALIASLGKISGGHFNPAVSVGVTMAGGLPPLMTVLYAVCQLAGAVLGALLTWGCLDYVPTLPSSVVHNGSVVHNSTVYEQIRGGAPALAPGVTPGCGLLTELLLTAVLVLCVLLAAPPSLVPAAVGATLAAAVLAGGGVTGAALNPARAFGPAAVVAFGPRPAPEIWAAHWVYWAGPLAGGVLAGALFRFVLASNSKRLIFNKDA